MIVPPSCVYPTRRTPYPSLSQSILLDTGCSCCVGLHGCCFDGGRPFYFRCLYTRSPAHVTGNIRRNNKTSERTPQLPTNKTLVTSIPEIFTIVESVPCNCFPFFFFFFCSQFRKKRTVRKTRRCPAGRRPRKRQGSGREVPYNKTAGRRPRRRQGSGREVQYNKTAGRRPRKRQGSGREVPYNKSRIKMRRRLFWCACLVTTTYLPTPTSNIISNL
jgi:hypothetical protein